MRVAEADAIAFDVLVRRHGRRYLAVAQAVVLNRSDADDVVQEAFLRLWRYAGDFDPRRAQFSTWMHRIVVNLSVDLLRKPRAAPLELAAEIADAAPGPLALATRQQADTAMQAALASLTVRHRTALQLFHMEELSLQESADAMGIGVDAFEAMLRRARAALKKQIGEAP